MRQAVAALVAAQTLASRVEVSSPTPALPEEPEPMSRSTRRRTMLWSWLALLWKAAHTGA